MLEAIIVIALYSFVMNIIEKPSIKKLKETTCAHEAIKMRKKIKKIRYIGAVTLFLVYIVPLFFIESDPNIMPTRIGTAFCSIYLTFREKSNLSLNISLLSIDDIISSDKPFVLYLRGFNRDSYNMHGISANGYFSEYIFMKTLRKSINVVAVGMTKEISSPEGGAQRVYLNDDTWQHDVKLMMEKAYRIVILVNDKDSCIWEIEQSAAMLDKTVYIVDDFKKYDNVRDILNSPDYLPEIIGRREANQAYCIGRNKGKAELMVYKNKPSCIKMLRNRYIFNC